MGGRCRRRTAATRGHGGTAHGSHQRPWTDGTRQPPEAMEGRHTTATRGHGGQAIEGRLRRSHRGARACQGPTRSTPNCSPTTSKLFKRECAKGRQGAGRRARVRTQGSHRSPPTGDTRTREAIQAHAQGQKGPAPSIEHRGAQRRRLPAGPRPAREFRLSLLANLASACSLHRQRRRLPPGPPPGPRRRRAPRAHSRPSREPGPQPSSAPLPGHAAPLENRPPTPPRRPLVWWW